MKTITKSYLIDAGAPLEVFEDCAKLAWNLGLEAEISEILKNCSTATCKWILMMCELDSQLTKIAYQNLDIVDSILVYQSSDIKKEQ